MSGNTPGPWSAQEYASPTGTYFVRGANDEKIIGGGVSLQEGNARLIAAAPDMLAALRMIVEGPWPDDVDDPQKQAIWDEKIARAAIAKAEGRT